MAEMFHKAYVLISKETVAWGTEVTPAKDLGVVTKIGMKNTNNTEQHYSLSTRLAQDTTVANFGAEGDVVMRFKHGRILEYAIGAVSHAFTTPDTVHTFTVGTLPSFTLDDGINSGTDYVDRYLGCKVNSLKINAELGQPLMMTANLVAKTVNLVSSAETAVISTIASHPYHFCDLKVGTATSEASLGKTESWELTLDNGLSKGESLSTRLLTDLDEMEAKYNFTFTKRFENHDEYKRFLGIASGAVLATSVPIDTSIIFTSTNGTALGSGKREFYLNSRNAQYSEVETAKNVGEKVVSTFAGTFRSIYSCTNTDNVAEASW